MARRVDMERVLREERALLFDGKIEALPNLAKRKIDLLSRLDGQIMPAVVRELASENAALLDAAGRGIRSVLDRIEAARNAGETRTYDRGGRVRRLTNAPPATGTRA